MGLMFTENKLRAEKQKKGLYNSRKRLIFAVVLFAYKRLRMTNHFLGQPISVIMAVHDQATELKTNLPFILKQQYEGGYEVIVVDESSTDETEDVLKQLKTHYSNLYTSYIPASSHYLSRRKLALTIGMKAAHNEWVIITEADCQPVSEHWLSSMAEAMTNEVDMVCGYTLYTKGTKGRYVHLRLTNWLRQLGHPYCYDGANLAIRKSVFMGRNGFLKNLQYLRSEYDFLVNETDRERIAVIKTQNSRLIQSEPTKKEWMDKQLYHLQSRRALKRKTLPSILFFFIEACIHLVYLLALLGIGYSAYRSDMFFITLSSAFLLLLLILHVVLGRQVVKSYGEHIAWWKLPVLDLSLAWFNLYCWLRFLMANKYDFVRK